MKAFKLFIVPMLLSAIIVMASATDVSKETERVDKSTRVLKDFSKMKESIPHDLIAEYEGVVIIPGLLNAGFGIGAKR